MSTPMIPHDERRDAVRYRADLDVTLRAYRMPTLIARLVDVSASGAMLAIGAEVSRGDEVIVEARGIEIVCTIAWLTEGFCGLSFHRRLQMQEIARLRAPRRGLVARTA